MKSRRSKILFIVFLAIVVLMAGIAYCFFLHPFWANSGTQAEDGQSDYADQFHIEQYVSAAQKAYEEDKMQRCKGRSDPGSLA